MDEQTRALYQQLLGELYRRMEQDPEIRRALRRIEEGNATFRDTAVWSDRSAELLGEVLSEAITDMPAEARESLCKALLRERYDSTNDICGEVQEALDERLGISLKPVKPKFPVERVRQIAHSLLDPTVEASVIERRAGAPVATVSKSFHDDYIRENASARTDLGFKCYLDRIAAPGCCKWCTGVAGRYVYGDHPDDIFHRHDNCACTVTFENGRERQDVWSKRTWQEDPAEVEARANRVTVLSEDQAKEIEENAVSQNVHMIRGKFKPSVKMDTIIGGKPISLSFQKELSDEYDKFTELFGAMSNVRSVTAYPYQNDGIWGAYNDNSYELFLFGAGGDDGRTLLAETAKQMRKDGKWSTSSVYHTFRHELGHALQAHLKRTDPNFAQKIQQIETIQKNIQESLTDLSEDDRIKKMKSILSEYGIDDKVDEFIAECIAEYCSGKPRSTAKTVVEILMKGEEQNAG